MIGPQAEHKWNLFAKQRKLLISIVMVEINSVRASGGPTITSAGCRNLVFARRLALQLSNGACEIGCILLGLNRVE
jgi:hypothetical protein